LRFLLGEIQEELNVFVVNQKKVTEFSDSETAHKFYFRANNCIIDQLFAGQIISKITCLHCNHNSFSYDPFLDISLPIIPNNKKLDLYQSLSSVFGEEKLDENYKCEKCKLK
jgi:ubiquitin carboxyl-terminal hydrolase 2